MSEDYNEFEFDFIPDISQIKEEEAYARKENLEKLKLTRAQLEELDVLTRFYENGLFTKEEVKEKIQKIIKKPWWQFWFKVKKNNSKKSKSKKSLKVNSKKSKSKKSLKVNSKKSKSKKSLKVSSKKAKMSLKKSLKRIIV
jgi:hypothetical protein